MKKILKWLVLLMVGGVLYYGLELFFRGRSHWSMIIVGGVCFWLIGMVNEVIPWEMPLVEQCLIGSIIITNIEFISGMILNVYLKWNVWDYSNLPLNINGQVCLWFSILWIFVAGVAIVIDDYLRYWLFHENKPYYKTFGGKRK